MKIKENFKADRYGNLDRSDDRSEKINFEDFDKKTIEAVEAGGTYGKLILATFDYIVNKIIQLINYLFVGFFRDGYSAQDPVIIGSIPTQTDGVKDVPTDDIKKKTHVTESGHTVIFDDTPGNIQIVHQAGSSITMDKDGGITIVSKPGQKTKIV